MKQQLIWLLFANYFVRPGPGRRLAKIGRGRTILRPGPGPRPGQRSRSGIRQALHWLPLPGLWLKLVLALALGVAVGLGLTMGLVNNNTASAQVVTPAPLENSIYDSDTFKVADQLQCPVCQGVTVAYSNSGLAQQMRLLIKKKLETGETKEQILQYFVDRYGESILTNPPKSGFTLLVWLLPVAGLLVGAGTVGYALRNWKVRIRSRTGRVQSGSFLQEAFTGPGPGAGAGTGEWKNQPATNKEAGHQVPTGVPRRAGLDANKLQEYQARVEAELAAFAYREEWGNQPLQVEPGLVGQSTLSRERGPAQTPGRKINPPGKG